MQFLVPPPMMPLAKPSQFTNKNNRESDKCNGNNTHDETDVPYEPGDATEMLSQSVHDLKIENCKEDFRAKAGKILTTMLENRLNQRNAINSNGLNGKTAHTNGNGLIELNGNKIKSNLNEKPLLPLSKPIAKLSPIIVSNAFASIAATANTVINEEELTKSLSPSSSISDLPLPPPPPAELIISNDDYAIDQKNASDINENDIRQIFDVDVIKQSVDDISAVRGTNTQLHQNGRNEVVYRNKNTPSRPELTTHARDRRSYIGQDNYNQNKFNHNNNLITSHTTEIANNFANGKHPICSVCHVKITR